MSSAASAAAQAPPPPTQTPPPAAQAPAPVAPAAKADVKAYEVGPGDKLSIVIYGENELPKEFLVGADGLITFPLIGDMKVAGLTVRGIESEIRKRLMDGAFLTNPQVVASVTEYRSQVVQVTGSVNRPGDIMLSGTEMTLTRALSRAELTALSGSYVEIRRRKPGADPNDQGPDAFDLIRVERKDLEDMKVDPTLRDGDRIFVPKAPVFFINGFVKTVGPQVWSPGMTVGKAIAMAGGISEQGTRNRLQIRRLVNGEYKLIAVKENTLVLPEDQIEVPRRRW